MMNQIIRKIKENKESSMFILLWLFYLQISLFGLGTSWQKIEAIGRFFYLFSFPFFFNLNLFVFIPFYLRKRFFLKYFLLIILSYFFIDITRLIVRYTFYLPEENLIDYSLKLSSDGLSFSFGLAMLFSFGYRFSMDWLLNIKRIERLKAEKNEMELAFLKSQVDPHFLFNTLNSIYSLALEEESDATAKSITQLGQLMRYNLHDSNSKSIPLIKEIEYIKNYIALQKLRVSAKNKITFKIDIDDTALNRYSVAPMIFIPFVENAFKYGLNPSLESLIDIKIEMKENKLILKIKNNIVAKANTEEESLIGLRNVKQRLELLYKNNFELEIKESSELFEIKLEINLQ